MEMTMRLPSNYVEIEEEEMMYLDGGGYTGIAIGTGLFKNTLKGALYGVAIAVMSKYAILNKIISILKWGGQYLKQAALIGAITSAVKYGIDWVCTKVTNHLDSSGNGWIGIYTSKYGFYTQ